MCLKGLLNIWKCNNQTEHKKELEWNSDREICVCQHQKSSVTVSYAFNDLYREVFPFRISECVCVNWSTFGLWLRQFNFKKLALSNCDSLPGRSPQFVLKLTWEESEIGRKKEETSRKAKFLWEWNIVMFIRWILYQINLEADKKLLG